MERICKQGLEMVSSIMLSSFHIKNLAAISLWVLVKVVHGSSVDVDLLERADVEHIPATKICDDVEFDTVEAPKLYQTNQYPKFNNA